MKTFSKAVLIAYLLTLLWLVLFKFSFDIFSVLFHHQMRSLNLVPFAGFSQGNMREMLSNFIVFIPFGLLLSVTFKQVGFWRKLMYVFVFSLSVEATQFVLAIGTTDVTDIITNTFGGLMGLALYSIGTRYVDDEKLNRCIVVVGMILLITLLFFRFFVLKVRY